MCLSYNRIECKTILTFHKCYRRRIGSVYPWEGITQFDNNQTVAGEELAFMV